MRRTPVLAALLAIAALLGPVAPSATAATAPPSVTLHVTDAEGAALSRIRVYAYSDSTDRFVDLGSTNANGDVVAARGKPRHYLGVGRWTIGLYDDDEARQEAGTSYLQKEFAASIKRGVNDLGTQSLALGSQIAGTLRTPSGLPVKNYGVIVENDSFGYGTTTSPDGGFVFGGLEVGTYSLSTYEPEQCCSFSANGPRVTLTEPGDSVTQDLVVQPKATKLSLTGVTPGPGVEQLTYVVSAARYGIASPGGTVTIVVDGDRAHPVTQPVDGSRAVVTITGLAPGSHSFVASYTGSDVVAKRIGITKTVR